MMMGVVLFSGSCSEDDTPDPVENNKVTVEAMDAVIATYVDRVVVPTYAEMEDKVNALKSVVDKLKSSSSQADLDAACDAWRASRLPWEQSEAFLYGPADYENLDPSLDSWPLEKDAIDQLLASQDFSSIGGGDAGDEGTEAQGVRGFHTLEYLLFDEGEPKKITRMTDNEKAYAQAVANRLLQDTKKLHSEWKNGYAAELKTHTSSRTSSAANVLGEYLINGIITIANEVGEQKIGNPYNEWKSGNEAYAVLQVESWYSFNSLTDYVNNIISVESAYQGGRPGNRDAATSLSALVASVDENLDKNVVKQIEATKAAITGIPHPFRSHLNANAEIEQAMDACADLARVFEQVKTKLGLN